MIRAEYMLGVNLCQFVSFPERPHKLADSDSYKMDKGEGSGGHNIPPSCEEASERLELNLHKNAKYHRGL
jgi:hypothetical protein